MTWLVSSGCTAAAGLTIVRKWASYRGTVQFLRLLLAYRRETIIVSEKSLLRAGDSAHENFKRASREVSDTYVHIGCPHKQKNFTILRAKLDR